MDFEINAAGEVFPVVQFGNKIDVVFPELIMCADVYCAGVVFGHQVQPVQSFHRQVVFRQKVEFEIHTCGRLSVMREPAGTVCRTIILHDIIWRQPSISVLPG